MPARLSMSALSSFISERTGIGETGEVRSIPGKLAGPAPAAAEPDFAALLGPVAWGRLHPDIRRRFIHSCRTIPVVYEGSLNVRRSVAGAFFALLAKLFGGPLPLRQCHAVSALVQVRGDGKGGVIWERWLRFPGLRRACCVRSVKRMSRAGDLLECVGGGLGMVLMVFEAQGALVFESRRYFLEVRGIRLPLPALLTPGRCRVAHREMGPGRFEFVLTMDHAVFGRTFSQTGIFLDPEASP
jgi:hypothetical protein